MKIEADLAAKRAELSRLQEDLRSERARLTLWFSDRGVGVTREQMSILEQFVVFQESNGEGGADQGPAHRAGDRSRHPGRALALEGRAAR